MIRTMVIRIVAMASIAVCVLVAIADALRGWPSGGFYLIYGAVAVVFVVVGWLIAERRPGNAVGPLLVAFGVLFAWYLPADLYLHLPGPLPGAAFAALFVSFLDSPMFILIALTLILFPDGRPPTPRWRWAIRFGFVGIGLAVVGFAFGSEGLLLFPEYRSPLAIDGFPGLVLVYLSYLCMTVMLVVAAAAVIVRWRRGGQVERTQIKWVVAASVVMVLTEFINVLTFRPDEPNALTNVLANIGIALIPISMGVAILRYRLYEIDRIVSRTIGYAVVLGILGVIFAGGILLLQAALARVTQGQTIAVATSTLVVFALFQPILRRVRHAVDRRFDRAAYDAERTVADFTERLRSVADTEAIRYDLLTTVRVAVAPTGAAMWLRPGRTER